MGSVAKDMIVETHVSGYCDTRWARSPTCVWASGSRSLAREGASRHGAEDLLETGL